MTAGCGAVDQPLPMAFPSAASRTAGAAWPAPLTLPPVPTIPLTTPTTTQAQPSPVLALATCYEPTSPAQTHPCTHAIHARTHAEPSPPRKAWWLVASSGTAVGWCGARGLASTCREAGQGEEAVHAGQGGSGE